MNSFVSFLQNYVEMTNSLFSDNGSTVVPFLWEFKTNGNQNDEPAAEILLQPLINAQRYNKRGSAATWTATDSDLATIRLKVSVADEPAIRTSSATR